MESDTKRNLVFLLLAIFIIFIFGCLIDKKNKEKENEAIMSAAKNGSFYVGYSIKDLSPSIANYNAEEKKNSNMPIVSNCDSFDPLNVTNKAINPIPLQGFGTVTLRAKSGQCNDPDSHIKATVVAIKDSDNNYVILLSADFVAFYSSVNNNDFYVSKIRTSIVDYVKQKNNIDLKSNRIMLSSTHNHSGPSYTYESASMKAYSAFMQRQINEAVSEALNDMKKADITYDTLKIFLDGQGNVTTSENYTGTKKFLGYVRHYTTDNYVYADKRTMVKSVGRGKFGFKCTDSSHKNCDSIYTRSTYVGHTREPDYDMQVLKISFSDSSKPILMLNWQAHPGVQGGVERLVITADYVGYLRKYLEEKGYRVSYYQGAAGDINTNSYIKGDSFTITYEKDGKTYQQEVMYGADKEGPAKRAVQTIGYKLGEIIDKRIKSGNFFKNKVKYNDGIVFYQESNKTELEANKIKMYLRKWDNKNSKGVYLYNIDTYANAYFISKISEVTEKDINTGSDNLKRIINGNYSLEEWKKGWQYTDQNGKSFDFKFPKILGSTEAQVSEKLISILLQYNSEFYNMFNLQKNGQSYKLAGYNFTLNMAIVNEMIDLLGTMMDDINTPDIDEGVCNHSHADIIKSIYNQKNVYSNAILNAFSIGNIGFITAPYEMFSSNGKYIKSNSPYDMTFILAYSNGAYYGYIPDKESFSYKSYETDITLYVEGTGETNAQILVSRLKEIYDWSTTTWYNKYTYTLDNTNNFIILTKYNGKEETVFVPKQAIISGKTFKTKISNDLFNGNKSIRYVTFEDGIKTNTSIKNLFRDCTNLISINLNNLDTSNVTDMSYIFFGCFNLETVDISKIKTSNVTNMHGMFTSCEKLTSLSLLNFDTSKVVDMQSMFYGCKNLKSIELTSFNTQNVTNFISMFHGCSSLEYLNLTGFNTSNATNMYRMFYNCSSLKSIYINNLWNTSKVTNSTEMFYNCKNIKGENDTSYDETKLDKTYARIGANGYFSSWYSNYKYDRDDKNKTITLKEYTGKEESIRVPSKAIINNNTYSVIISKEVYKENKTIKYVYFEDGVKAGESLNSLFKDCTNLLEIKLNNFDTSNVVDMSYMFYGCSNLLYLDISKINTSKVTNMHGMFTSCEKLTSLSLLNFDTSKVKDMQSMFYGCSNLKSINLSSFDTSNVVNFISMFQGCSNLVILDISSFNTSKATNMYRMFYGCTNLSNIYVSNKWNTSKVTSSTEMFYNCKNIKGEFGTKYNSSKIDKTYAQIDDLKYPGYFTYKASLQDIFSSNNYTLNGKYVTIPTNGESISTIKSKLGNDIEVETNKTIISTGAVIKADDEAYTVVVKGDLNGDGKVNSGDLLEMRNYLNEKTKLTGAYKEAGIIESNNEIKSLDLLRLRQYLLGNYKFK